MQIYLGTLDREVRQQLEELSGLQVHNPTLFVSKALAEVPESILKKRVSLKSEIEGKLASLVFSECGSKIPSIFKVSDELEYFIQAFTKRLRILQSHSGLLNSTQGTPDDNDQQSDFSSGSQTQRASFAHSMLTPSGASGAKKDILQAKIKDYSQRKLVSPSKQIFNHAIAATRMPLTARKVGNMRVGMQLPPSKVIKEEDADPLVVKIM